MKRWLLTLLTVLNLLMYLVVIGLWISIPDELNLNRAVSGLTLLMTLGLLVTNRQKFKAFYTSKFFGHLFSHTLTVFFLLVILGFLNFLAYKNPLFWDISQYQRASLTAQSRQVLQDLKKPVRFVVLAPKSYFARIKGLLELYRLESPMVDLDFVDAELRPDKVREYGVTQVPKLVLESGPRRKKAKELNELSITNALIKITRPRDPLILYTTGHDEIDFKSEENTGGSELKKLIQGSGFDLRALDLRQVSDLSEEADLVVIWGAKSGFRDSELETLKKYLEKGGRLLVALDPSFKVDSLANLRGFIEEWGLSVPNNLIIDRLKHTNGSQGTVPIVAEYGSKHPITKGFKDIVFFPLASSVLPSTLSQRGRHAEVLAFSSAFPAAWGDSEPQSFYKGKVTYQKGTDLKGPLGYFGIYNDPKTKAKLMAFGNSTFVVNAYRKYPKNFNLFLNSINWLADEDRLISFNLPVIEEKPVFINHYQVGLIFYVVMMVLPLTLFGTAFYFYRRRRVL